MRTYSHFQTKKGHFQILFFTTLVNKLTYSYWNTQNISTCTGTPTWFQLHGVNGLLERKRDFLSPAGPPRKIKKKRRVGRMRDSLRPEVYSVHRVDNANKLGRTVSHVRARLKLQYVYVTRQHLVRYTRYFRKEEKDMTPNFCSVRKRKKSLTVLFCWLFPGFTLQFFLSSLCEKERDFILFLFFSVPETELAILLPVQRALKGRRTVLALSLSLTSYCR